MRRIAYFFVFALLVTTMSAGKAEAGVEWCSEDPTFVVNGNVIDLNTRFLAQYKSQVKPPVVVELLVPENAVAAVLTLPGSVPVVGKVTKSLPRWWGLLNMPVVARVSPSYVLNLNHDEVADTFEVPLGFLMDPARHELHSREWKGRIRRYYAMPYEGRYIWGVTAGIIRNLYERLYGT